MGNTDKIMVLDATSMVRAERFLVKKLPALKPLYKEYGPCPLRRKPGVDVYRSLARSIVYQQLAGKAAATIFGRVTELGEDGFPEPQRIIRLRKETLRKAGLSWRKVDYLKDLATFSKNGKLPSSRQIGRLTNDQVIENLTRVKGIGPWSVQMFLMFDLGRADVWPIGDLSVRKNFLLIQNIEEETDEQLTVRSMAFSPWRSVLSWYLWRYDEHRKKLKQNS